MGQPKRKEPEPEPLAEAPAAAETEWTAPVAMSRRGWGIVAAVVLAVNFPLIHYYLLRSRPEAPLTVPYQDSFSSPQTVAQNYWSSGGLWRVVNGELVSPGVKNNPLWLKAKLPADVAIEFDCRSMSPEGDLKVEVFGDGSDHASGYVLIHGGWNNSKSIIARRDEHGAPLHQLQARAQALAAEKRLPSAGVVETGVFKASTRMTVENPRHVPVQVGRTYRWRIERKGGLLRWYIDGQPYMEFNDPFPLRGPDHDRLGFSSWEAQLYFDNLKIEPL